MVIDTCPACGYPKFGPGLCAFCTPVPAPDEASGTTPTTNEPQRLDATTGSMRSDAVGWG
jgi:hypothetical protein